MNMSDILGRWRIVAWRQNYDDGRIAYPLGERPRGFIQYNADQTMCLLLTAADRAPFARGGQWNAEEAEMARAYSTCLSYAGGFSLHGAEVHHQVEISLFPNWVGGVQRRQAALIDGELHLIARLESSTPEARTATLVWQRAPHGGM